MHSRLPVLILLPCLGACGLFGPKFEPRLAGDACVEPTDCLEGLVCAHDAVCRFEGEPGTTPLGGTCSTSVACRVDLVCSGQGLCAEPGDAGTAAQGDSCDAPEDCISGLSCLDGTCYGLEIPFWAGATCPERGSDDGPFRVYFEVPDGEPLSDFYRLPFPTDIRRDGDTLDLSGHPEPGVLVDLLGDVVGEVLDAVSQDLGAFGNNQTVLFRFSGDAAFESLTLGPPGEGSVYLVDVTEGSEDFGTEHPSYRIQLSGDRTPWICHDWFAIHPHNGRPFTPGHTYAAILSRDIRDEDGVAVVPDEDFGAMVADEPPAAPHLAQAWQDHAPLRAWLADADVSPDALAAAAVFTVQDPTEGPPRLRQKVRDRPVPALADAVLCGVDDDVYADPDDETAGCQRPGAEAFVEVHGTLDLPQFQQGTPPYKTPGDGGAIDLSTPEPAVQRTEPVHVTLTVPTGPMPEAGWPILLYGHGTGGRSTSLVRTGLIDALSTAPDPSIDVPFATLSFDAPFHGDRTFPEGIDPAWLEVDPGAYDPDVLFFNPLNPVATRDNALQEAADLWSLTAWIEAMDWTDATSPTGLATRFDPDRTYYLGHSQGGVVGTLYAAYEDALDGVVLSGAGGLTIEALLHKTSPQDVPAAVSVGLADPGLERTHPILNLAQALAERSDGVNHAHRLLHDPPADRGPIPVLQVFGVGDTYAPDETQYPLARALHLQQVPGTSGTTLEGITPLTAPVTANVSGTTGVVALYSPGDRDAHFVLFDRSDTQADVVGFLFSAARDGVPTFGE